VTGKTDSSVRSSAVAAKKENVLSPIPIRFTSALGRVHGENEFFSACFNRGMVFLARLRHDASQYIDDALGRRVGVEATYP
jgi:hypothetical protein